MVFPSDSNVTLLFAWNVDAGGLPCLHAMLCFLKNSSRESMAASVNFCFCIMLSMVGEEVVYSDDDAITEVGDDDVFGGGGTTVDDESL